MIFNLISFVPLSGQNLPGGPFLLTGSMGMYKSYIPKAKKVVKAGKQNFTIVLPKMKPQVVSSKRSTGISMEAYKSLPTNSIYSALEPSVPLAPAVQQTAASPFAPLTPGEILTTKKVSVNVSATPIDAVIGILSKQSNLNIVLIAKADQKVTMNVKEMPMGEALKHLATISGLKMLEVGNAVVMADDTTLKASYPKEYEAAYEPKVKVDPNPATQPTQPAGADIVQRVYTLKFQGGTQVAAALKDYLATLKVTIYALPNTTIPSLGTGSSGLNSVAAAGNSQTSGPSQEPRLKQVLLSGPADGIAMAMNILEQMDKPRKQVEIRVTIHDVSNDALKDAGFTWDFGQTTISEKVSGNMNLGTFSRTGLSFVNTIHALEQSGKSKLLASPNVSVMDGEIGSMLIGEKRRFPVVTGTNSNGQFIYSTEEQNVGIYLLVASDVSQDGTITLAVNAQVSSILGFLQLNGGSYPQISTRESKSTLILKNGETMVMGGLLRDEEIVNFQKVPLLSQIPFFGELFNNRKKQKNSSQLVISITPHVVTTQ